jgi:hypothetical protein
MEKIKRNGKMIKIELEMESKSLLKSIESLLPGVCKIENNKSITFYANEVIAAQINENTIEDISKSLKNQIDFLEKEKKSFIKFEKHKIINVDKIVYFQLSEEIFELKENKIKIDVPFEKEESCMAKEVEETEKLPSFVNKDVIIYSLGLLLKNSLQYDMERYKGTRVYYMIKRCLEKRKYMLL